MSLRDGSAKMSKSDPSDASRINLVDDADTIMGKIRKAKTDAEAIPSEEAGLKGRPEADNLIGIFAALADRPVASEVRVCTPIEPSTLKPSTRVVACCTPICARAVKPLTWVAADWPRMAATRSGCAAPPAAAGADVHSRARY